MVCMIRSQTLLDNIYKKGFKRPSKIQAAALPIVLNMEKGKRNIIAQGQSGTGKTATYVLGMYNMVDPKVPQFKAICLEPTRELARQTFDVCQELSEGTGIKSKLIVTGTKSLFSTSHFFSFTGSHLCCYVILRFQPRGTCCWMNLFLLAHQAP